MKFYKTLGVLIILLIIVIGITFYFKKISNNPTQIIKVPSIVDLETSGNNLEKIFKSKCILPIYNDVPLLGFVQIAGCGTIYWPSITGTNNTQINDYEIKSRENFKKLLLNEGCSKNYVSDYLFKLSNNPEGLNEKTFSSDLLCAGKITLKKIQFIEE
jgi:hypothetical protein